MKQQQIVNAYKAIQKYQNQKLPLNVSYGLFKVKRALQPLWDFEVEQERAIFDKYNPTQDEKTGEFKFASAEDKEEFLKSMGELLNMEADYDEDKFEIDFGDHLEMPIADIEALDDFIKF